MNPLENDTEMDELLASHALAPGLLRKDAFDEFIEDRRRRLSGLVEVAMGSRSFTCQRRRTMTSAVDRSSGKTSVS